MLPIRAAARAPRPLAALSIGLALVAGPAMPSPNPPWW